MNIAVVISSITILGLVAAAIQKFDKEGTEMFKVKNDNEEEECD